MDTTQNRSPIENLKDDASHFSPHIKSKRQVNQQVSQGIRPEHKRAPKQLFKNKVVWITGASSGIGAALAEYLAERGAKLILASQQLDQLESVRTRLTRADKHHSCLLDLEQPESINSKVQSVLAKTGPIDILINNAGIAQHSLVIDTQLAVDRRIMEINFFGTIAMTKAVLPSMLERQKGQIITVSSIAGIVGSQSRSTYSASKHALNGYMDSLRAEVWHDGVRVQLICPGWVNTDIGKRALDGEGNPLSDKVGTINFGVTPEECAEGIAKAILNQRAETIIARGLVRVLPLLKRFWPSLLNRATRRKVCLISPRDEQ